MINAKYQLDGRSRLDPSRTYSYEEIVDRISLSKFGKNLDWFREHGHIITTQRKPEEAYPRPYFKGRMPVYLEHLIEVGSELEKFTNDVLKIEWDTSDYQPLPDWKPCPAYEDPDSEYDLYLVNYKIPQQAHTSTTENPLLTHLSEKTQRDFLLQVNTSTARRKGFKNGDTVLVESKEGVTATATLRVTELVHEEVAATPGIFGHWAERMPQSKGRGVNINSFIPLRLDRIDPLSSALDTCVKVKIRRVEEPVRSVHRPSPSDPKTTSGTDGGHTGRRPAPSTSYCAGTQRGPASGPSVATPIESRAAPPPPSRSSGGSDAGESRNTPSADRSPGSPSAAGSHAPPRRGSRSASP